MAREVVVGGETAPLWMSGFGAGYGDRVVLAEIDLELPPTGLTALMGPVGVGKSTLLRAICGIAQQNASFKTWGELRYLGLMPGEAGWPSLVAQDARLMVSTVRDNLSRALPDRSRLTLLDQRQQIAVHIEQLGCQWLIDDMNKPVVDLRLEQQRAVAILRQTIAQPRLLCVDEPTVGLDDEQAALVLGLLQRWSRRHAVLLVSHHQRQVRDYADTVSLLASGRIQESAPPSKFFSTPVSEPGREFVRSGSCSSPRPDAAREELAEDVSPPPPLPVSAHKAMSAWAGPNGFVWLEKGRLAGTPRPGVVNEPERDFEALARVGVTRLLTLLEAPLGHDALLAEHGMASVHVAINDMAAPTHEQAVAICRQIESWLGNGEVVAVHCLAGHGRTGTALAAWRIWLGDSALDAIEAVRTFEQRWIQSRAQVEFLESFEAFLKSENGAVVAGEA